jgi:transcriptional repressor NrdR
MARRSGGGGNVKAALRALRRSSVTVIKSEDRREPFARDKLHTSVSLACRKRGVEAEQIDQLVSGIQRQLETSGETEIASKQIGKMVMEGLQQLDSVAYIRFASVYKDFREARDFEEFAGSVKDLFEE